MELESDDAACHAVLCLAEDADTTAERFTSSPETPLMFLVLREERDLVIEIVATNLRGLAGVVLEAGRAADVNAASNHKVAGVLAHEASRLFFVPYGLKPVVESKVEDFKNFETICFIYSD